MQVGRQDTVKDVIHLILDDVTNLNEGNGIRSPQPLLTDALAGGVSALTFASLSKPASHTHAGPTQHVLTPLVHELPAARLDHSHHTDIKLKFLR